MPYKPKAIKPSWVPERKPFNNSKKNSDFYNSWRWRKTALAYREKNPICVKCDEEGIIKASEVVDHIKEINSGGAKFDESNFQALCHSCHNSKSGKAGANSKKLTVVTERYKPKEENK